MFSVRETVSVHARTAVPLRLDLTAGALASNGRIVWYLYPFTGHVLVDVLHLPRSSVQIHLVLHHDLGGVLVHLVDLVLPRSDVSQLVLSGVSHLSSQQLVLDKLQTLKQKIDVNF